MVPASVPGSSEISQHFKVRIPTARSLNSSLPEENLMSRWLVLSFEVRSPSSVSQLRGPSLFRTEDCGQDTRTRTLTAVQVFFLFFFFGAEDARLTWRSDKSGSERSSIWQKSWHHRWLITGLRSRNCLTCPPTPTPCSDCGVPSKSSYSLTHYCKCHISFLVRHDTWHAVLWRPVPVPVTEAQRGGSNALLPAAEQNRGGIQKGGGRHPQSLLLVLFQETP